ncbi:hypothetical protein [Pseudaquidulcibacter saccharophilus]|uniref:hypothetical protein n=1 Tax=Pseudaquidulcibacter saccharophilus TaxID=2831900 RepID=UPI001EFF408F|nr:hypothetical protein [Pseudaquidulcibacter saccharophilus]
MVFSEVQSGSRPMIYAILAFMVLLAIIEYIVVPVGAKMAVSLIMSIILGLVATMLFGFNLETKIDAKNISLKIPVLLKTKIAVADIISAEQFSYSPLRDFGGWGIRYGKGGIMYNANGNQSVKLVMKDGKIIYIGTQKPEALINALGK